MALSNSWPSFPRRCGWRNTVLHHTQWPSLTHTHTLSLFLLGRKKVLILGIVLCAGTSLTMPMASVLTISRDSVLTIHTHHSHCSNVKVGFGSVGLAVNPLFGLRSMLVSRMFTGFGICAFIRYPSIRVYPPGRHTPMLMYSGIPTPNSRVSHPTVQRTLTLRPSAVSMMMSDLSNPLNRVRTASPVNSCFQVLFLFRCYSLFDFSYSVIVCIISLSLSVL